MKITKLLALDALPAPALLAKAKRIALTYAERLSPPASFTIGEETFENAMNASRPIEVGDAALDEKGHFYVFEARPEALYKVTGDEETLKEAAWAFLARGMRIADSVDGFVIVQKEQFKSMLESVGLTVTSFTAPFTPIPLPRHEHHGGCCCGHHHHEGECSCGHHHHEGECGCGCRHHEEGEECSCGHHHHHGEKCDCGCHHHKEGEDCSCGHCHHEGECGCGCHHHEAGEECSCGHRHEGECGCGCHHHEVGEKCSCGRHHHHGEKCGCGHHHHDEE